MSKVNFNLDGKVALITGAGRGIGRAFTEGLAEAGADYDVSIFFKVYSIRDWHVCRTF